MSNPTVLDDEVLLTVKVGETDISEQVLGSHPRHRFEMICANMRELGEKAVIEFHGEHWDEPAENLRTPSEIMEGVEV